MIRAAGHNVLPFLVACLALIIYTAAFGKNVSDASAAQLEISRQYLVIPLPRNPMLVSLSAAALAERSTGQQISTSGGRSVENYAIPEDDSDLDDVKQRLAQIQGIGDAYGDRLGELHLQLGHLYRHRDRYDDAVEQFGRALHLTRINSGLYSLDQLAIIEPLISTFVANGDWTDAGRNQKLRVRLIKRHYGPDSPELRAAMFRLGAWLLHSYSQDSGAHSLNDLVNARYLFQECFENGWRPDDALAGFLLTSYHLALFPGLNAPAPAFKDFLNSRNQFRSRNNPVTGVLDHTEFSQEIFRDGLSLIDSRFDNAPTADQTSEPVMLRAQADWHHAFDEPATASILYRRALLSDPTGEEPADADTRDDDPVLLPAVYWNNIAAPPSEQDAMIELSGQFDVTYRGRGINLQISDSADPSLKRLKGRVRSALRSARFRPRNKQSGRRGNLQVQATFLIPDQN